MVDVDHKIIDINENNVDENDLFCLKSRKTKSQAYKDKVNWFKERTKEGLKIKLLLVKEHKGMTSRGFIEYIPGEKNWRGIL